MVLSNKKLKQKLREAKAETLVIGESEHSTKKRSKRKADSNSELEELLEALKQRPRLSKREKRRKTQSLQGVGSSKDNLNGESEKVEGEEKKKRKKQKKRKRESEDSDGVVKEMKKKKQTKKQKKKKKGKKESNGIVEAVETIEVASKENGESEMMGDFGMKVYVGGIPYYSTEDDIRSYFESCGTITEVDCMTFPDSGKFRGIAIISFKTEAAAKRALDLDGSDMGGFFLKIQPYKTTKAKKETNKVPNFAPQVIEGYNRIYIGNLYWDITEDDIKKFFSDCDISSIRFGMDKDTGEFKGFAHVDFSDNQSLATALKLDQQILCGRSVKISCAVPPKKGVKIQAGNVPLKKEAQIQAANVPPKKEAEIQAINDSTTSETNSQGTIISSGKMKRRTCYECGEKGHISTACPKMRTSDPTNPDTN